MTIINPNSIAGITSVTAEAGVMNFYKSDGTLAGLQLNGVNFNTTAGVSTFNDVYVGGTITYEDVKNVDSIGIITARTGIIDSTLTAGRVVYVDSDKSLTDSANLTFNGNNVTLEEGRLFVKRTTIPSVDVRNSTNTSYSRVILQQGAAEGGYFQISREGTNSTAGAGANSVELNQSSNHPLTIKTNNTERLRITGAGRVGINETSPDTDLHIKNTNPAIILEGTNGSGRQHKIWSAGTNSETLQITSGNYYNNADVHYFRATNESTVQARIDNTGIGIGGVTPARELHVHSSGSDSTYIVLTNGTTGTTTGDGFGIGLSGSEEAKLWNYENTPMIFATNSAERLRITSDGKVSISSDGTADGLLTIKGNSDATTTPSIRLLDGSDSREVSISNQSGDFIVSVHGTDNAAHGHIKLFEGGQIDLNNGGASGSNVNRLRIRTDGQLQVSAPNSNSHFAVGNSSGTMVVLDTTEPSAVGVGGRIVFGSKYYNSSNTMAGAFIGQYKHEGPSNGVGEYRHHLNFGTRNENDGLVERMRITHQGRVGIGTETPSNALDVQAGTTNTAIVARSTDAKAQISLLDNSTTSVGSVVIGAEGDELFLTSGSGGTERLRIKSNGDVLIGRTSTSTSHTLCVQADNVAEAIAVIGRSADDISEIGFFENDTTTRLGELQYRRDHINFRHRVGDIRFCTAGTTERMRIDSNGDLNLGNNPTNQYGYKLNIQDSAIIYAQTASSNGTELKLYLDHSSTIANFGTVSTSHLAFVTANTERMRITSGGQVQITCGSLRIPDSGNSTANSTHTTGALRCNLIRSDTSNNNSYTGTYFMNVNAAGGGIKSVGIVETGLKVGDFTSNLAAAEKIKLTYDGHVEIKTDGGRLKIGAGNDLQMYHDNGGGTNHITCVNNHHLKVSAQSFQVYDYTGVTQYFRVKSGDDRVRVYGEAAVDGTSSGADGLSIAYNGGTSCPLYFGTETDVAQKSMYLKGYWIYLRGHVNEGMKFIFSQGGAAPHGNIYEFKYNSAKRPGSSTTWDGFSDARAKENVQSITNGIEKIKQLRPVTFDWTDDYADSTGMWAMDKSDPKEYNWVSKKENGYDTDAKNGQYGFLAQEYETVLPKDVKKEKFTLGDTEISDFRSLNHDSLIATLTAALKESIAKIETLETKVAALESA